MGGARPGWGTPAGTKPRPSRNWQAGHCRARWPEPSRGLRGAMELLPGEGNLEAAGRGEDPWEGEMEPDSNPRGSRTASLVSGLLTELYSCAEDDEGASGPGSGGPRGRLDSRDSSTEASGSDAFQLQELQEWPSPRDQLQFLRQKGEQAPIQFGVALGSDLGRKGDSCMISSLQEAHPGA